MKIWFPAIRAGSGSDVYVRRLSAALQARGIGVAVTWLPHLLELAPQLARVRPPEGTSLIHGHSWNVFAFARFGLPLVATVHSPIHAAPAQPYKSFAQRLYHDTLIRRYERQSFDRARTVVAVSHAAAMSVAETFPGVRPVVVHNWVDTRIFQPAPQLPQAAPARPFRLLFAGNRTRWKGWDLLAGLMARLGNGFELWVAAGLRSDVAPDELPPRARTLGCLRDEQAMARAYQACDAVLVPSRLEGFGYVAAEAMACGKPVIAFRNSALPELVTDQSTGLLVPTDDLEALAGACRRLAGDAGLVASMGAAARAVALDKFSEAAALGRYLPLYESLAGSAR
jgi:glycosyltransferase involved in cell wall biosynthesis